MPDDKRYDRRRFFREGLRELLKPLGRAIDPVHNAIKQFEAMSEPIAPPPRAVNRSDPSMPSVWLRPPGALFPDQSFGDTCSRCGECERVCPANCIRIDHTGERGDGVPYIEPDAMPCVVCDGLQCMQHCPSGALAPIPLADIDMGTAVWNESICVRGKGEQCTICVDVCPVGSTAIELRDGKINVLIDGCIGCGVCQHRCPTDPKSIIILSRAVFERRQANQPI